MNKSDTSYKISIYFKGDYLNTENITNSLGINPTESHKKGRKWTTPTGHEVTEKTGLWRFSIKNEDASKFTTIAKSIGDMFSGISHLLEHMTEIETAYVDILFLKDADNDGGGTCEFDFDKDALAALNNLGLPIQFTVGVVPQ